ncbi:uncharacterized protein si:ch211-174j14.2 [Epinephelus moara]|uniref:uncharacterized protein si:ch211-174j14.2 n=1 Tax=Epinephelus moara TaxID=300413 RepID=UPI00214F2856|nr:uncharacterized protein si:ch211-174j14.2 [Epinephelus moara]
MTGTVRDGPTYDRITEGLTSRGFPWSKGQVISKLKNVKKKFHKVNDHDRGSGRGQLDWPYFNLCQSIWGSANPVSIHGSLNAIPPAPASPASTKRSDEEADSQNVENGTESQTDQVPPSAKRRKATKAQLVAQEITDLMEAMDRKDDERERIRPERQVAHEAELQREVQEAVREEDRRERVEQFLMLAGMFQEQATLMRDLIN